jgi:hypothetical protein
MIETMDQFRTALNSIGLPAMRGCSLKANASHLLSGSCSSPRNFTLDFLQAPLRDGALPGAPNEKSRRKSAGLCIMKITSKMNSALQTN